MQLLANIKEAAQLDIFFSTFQRTIDGAIKQACDRQVGEGWTRTIPQIWQKIAHDFVTRHMAPEDGSGKVQLCMYSAGIGE